MKSLVTGGGFLQWNSSVTDRDPQTCSVDYRRFLVFANPTEENKLCFCFPDADIWPQKPPFFSDTFQRYDQTLYIFLFHSCSIIRHLGRMQTNLFLFHELWKMSDIRKTLKVFTVQNTHVCHCRFLLRVSRRSDNLLRVVSGHKKGDFPALTVYFCCMWSFGCREGRNEHSYWIFFFFLIVFLRVGAVESGRLQTDAAQKCQYSQHAPACHGRL